MREDLALRGMSANTIATYLGCARRYAEFHGRSPCTLGAAEVRAFLLHLAEKRAVAARTFNVYAAALEFLYDVTLERPAVSARIPRMRVPMHVPVVLTAAEVSRLLAALTSDKDRALLMLTYGAGLAFGHSYGGLVSLEVARQTSAFARLAVYEPAVSVDGCIPSGWLLQYRALLVGGDTRGAFACMVKGAGFAPGVISLLPLWYVRMVLRIVISSQRWTRMEPLLGANLAEHQEVVRLDGSIHRYSKISLRVLLLGGGNSPPAITERGLSALHHEITNSTLEILPGMGHTAPDEDAPEIVGEHVLRWLEACTREGAKQSDEQSQRRAS
jgi:pimeloyl-ACP methyl ester carboxylesterase